ncbi:MAG: M48 family metallopeptidase [Vicinamibacterales bacterium]
MKPLARAVLVLTLVATTAAAQTRITPPKNKYSPEEDVKIGREAAAEVRSQYPLITDSQITSYLDRLGRRLVESAPAELRQPRFEYSFTPVNLKEINAFALPGGPMFVNRGMMDAATTEGQVAGVMAHELSHVLLRHGTANATKAQGFQIGAIAGAIAGAVIGGTAGQVISQGSQFGIGTWFMKYSREYEKQADLLGAQIMARAGYDPRDLARMFETIEKQSGGSGPQWLSSHPNPGNRTQYINAEAGMLAIGPRPSDNAFNQTKDRFASLPPARSTADVEKGAAGGGAGGGDTAPASVGTIGSSVPNPSTQYRTERGGQYFQVSVPNNWTTLSSNNEVKYVPQNAYGPVRGGQTVMTHGVEIGMARTGSSDLRTATQTLIDGFVRGNPDMRVAGQQATRMQNRSAILTALEGSSALGGRELVNVYSALLADGTLFYFVTVVPERDRDYYTNAFNRVYRSIRFNQGT